MAAGIMSRNHRLYNNNKSAFRLASISQASFMTKAGNGSQNIKMSLLQRGLLGNNTGIMTHQSGLTQI